VVSVREREIEQHPDVGIDHPVAGSTSAAASCDHAVPAQQT